MYGESLPELPVAENLHYTWRTLGCVKMGASGPVPLDWVDIKAFNDLTEANLRPFEAECLVEMSRAFIAGLSDKGPLSIPPMERTHD